jgi:ATP-dependent protease HslVU (ClpYQ) ATPase subunit
MWLALKQKFGGTSVTKLRQLTIKFDTYKKRPNHSMRQHLKEMSNMISELKDADHILTDEQQIQALIRSLPHIWEHMKVNLTHNEDIKTLNDAVRHLELEEDRIEASKPQETEITMHLSVQVLMEDKARNISQMMARERANKRKSIRGSIVVRKRLLRTVLKSRFEFPL